MKFIKADRRSIPVTLSLGGKSGSGKTYSALLLATGLTEDPSKRFFIDTERGRGRMYADDPEVGGYQVGELTPPFTADRYCQAIMAAHDAGAETIIVDSGSHEWNGLGGCHDQVDEMVKQRGDRVKMVAWARAKTQHRRFVQLIAAPPCHLIICLRAKEKLEERVINGKKQYVTAPGLVAEQEKDFVYEMTASATIDEDHSAMWTKAPKPLTQVLKPGLITAEQGSAIRDWVNGGASFDQDVEHHLSRLREQAFEEGVDGVKAYWREHIKGNKALEDGLSTHTEELNAQAVQADEMRQQQQEALAKAEQ